ncbi:hypothetical protein [Bacillus sp. 1P06AnD]|uniref:hypothetical protein n=1 Tax=Bacillus sp. 1P06AnD TaxID=3132208 RepID=UPI0039A04FB4
MKARFEVQDMKMTLSNVTLPEGVESYVLMKATDGSGNEITLEMSHEQAAFLEQEFKDLNRRRSEHLYEPSEAETPDFNLFNFTNVEE